MGLWLVQFKAVLKRNYLIKRRYWEALIWEFMLPVLFIVMFGVINLTSSERQDPKKYWPVEEFSRDGNVSYISPSVHLLVAPNTTDSLQVAEGMTKRLGCTYEIFADEDEAVSSYLSNPEKTKIGLIFDVLPNSYSLRFTKDTVRLDLFSYNAADCSYNGCPAGQYNSSGMATLQAAIDSEIIKLQKGNFVPPVLGSQLMPELRRDVVVVNTTLQYMFPFYMVYALAFIAMYLTYATVDDKVKNRRDHMTMMGMSSSAYWAAWCVVNLPQAVFISIAGVIILLAFSFFQTSVLAYLFFGASVIVYSLCNVLIGICWATIIPKTELIFPTLLGTLALGAIGLVNILFTDYLSDPLQPQSIPVLSGIVCLIPPACMTSLLERMFILMDRYPGGLVAGAFTAGNLSLVVMFVILIIDIFLWAGIAMWLEGVLPNNLGGRLPFCFCLDRKYWKPDPADPEVVKSYELSVQIDDDADVEPLPRSMHDKRAIRLFNMKKEFIQDNGCSNTEVIHAVKDVTLDIYEGQITALLGHNGAGKTTLINMMTGMMPVTSGSATLYGYDITNGVDLQSIRQMIGICPQKDVILDRLTVREHLELYANIKGVDQQEIPARIQKIVEDCDLADQIDFGAEKLSGGQKRKLNVGMALIGDPKILFLDEPTAGLDPYSRRHLWTLLKKSRAGRVIVLTTHFMDEADVLADRKAVISKGRLQCAGSSLYLKNKFGVGYQLTLLVDDTNRQDDLTSAITGVIDTATHKRTFGKEVTYNLPIDQSTKFPDLFSLLESQKEQLSITNYSIAMVTLEEVFLKLGEQTEEEERLENERKDGRIGEHNNAVHPEVIELDNAINPINMTKEVISTDRLRLWYMVLQRLRMITREGFIIVSLILYTLFVAAGVAMMAISSNGIAAPTSPKNITLNVSSSTFSMDPQFKADDVLYCNKSSGNIDSLLSPLRSAVSSDFNLLEYSGLYTKTSPAESPFGYDIGLFISAYNDSNITIRYNHTYLLSLPLALNVLSNSLLSIVSNSSTPISTTLTEWPSGDTNVYAFNVGSFAGMVFVFAIYIGSSFYTIYIVGEKEKNLKPLLRTAGVTVNTYFGTYIIMYGILLGPALLIACIVLIAIPVPAFQAPLAGFLLILHMIIQLILVVLLSFCWSYAFQRAQTAGNVININIWLTLLFFTPVTILINIPSTVQVAKVLHHILCFVVPYYSFPGGLLMFFETHRAYLIEVNDLNADVPSIEYLNPVNGVLSAIIGGLIWVFLLFIFLRVGEIKATDGKLSDVFKCFANKLSTYNPSAQNDDVITDEDDDVVAEREKVEQLWDGSHSEEVVMKAYKLRKQFSRKEKSPKIAVRNLTFHVEEGQVFGLLGPNGAGKTTALNMIIAEHSPTAGQVMVDGIEVHSALSDAFELIGYCPQFDALWPTATPNELMVFIGISTGFSVAQAKAAANYYIKMLKIEEHRDKYTKNLSGGTQRKVSFALALMGWPRLVLLDEPSTGLDPSSKRFLWDTIRTSFSGHKRSAILTTHYMEEADALCTRIGIMVNGALECLGSAQHLKDKFGDGYQLEVKLKEGEEEGESMIRLKKFVVETFPQTTVIEEFSDRIQYAMPTTVVSSPGEVFGPLELNKERLQIEEYSFSQSTLEQVFIQFAKQQLQADEDEENALKSRQRSRDLLKRQKSVVSATGGQYTHL